MKFGVFMFTTDQTMPITDLARAAEERGFESLWVPEHVHLPVQRRSHRPGTPSDEILPEMYFRLYDPFVALAMAAAVTSDLKLATGICLITEHEPLDLAKRVASLDRLSNGRFVFGIGAGWLAEEMEALGTPFEQRWAVTQERIAAMKALWRDGEAAYHSALVEIPRTVLKPTPIQQPHPPIYIGATTRWARQRVVDWADGWMPNRTAPEGIVEGIADLRRRAQEAGRDPDSIPTSVFGADPDALGAYERAGAECCIFRLQTATADVVVPELDRLAGLVATHA